MVWLTYSLYEWHPILWQASEPAHFLIPAPHAGFWGTCYNDYKNTSPHEGYKILYKWRHRLFKPRPFAVDGDIKDQKDMRRMHIYTSNVDRMFYRSGFKLDEIEEIHGNAIIMQCAKPCAEHVWELDPQFRYQVEKQTMRAPPVKVNEEHDNHPSCPQCKGPARPNVLMFGDMYYFEATPANPDYSYKKFATDVENVLRANRGAKLVVLEMGAGKRVPSIRNHCQRWINDATLGDFAVTLIRINPDFPDLDPLAWHPTNSNKTKKWFNFISFKAGALETLKRIHEEMVKLVRAVDDSIDVESEDDSAISTLSSSSKQPTDASDSSGV
jgi:NAD-dependent SIR2 family protein deacetylase